MGFKVLGFGLEANAGKRLATNKLGVVLPSTTASNLQAILEGYMSHSLNSLKGYINMCDYIGSIIEAIQANTKSFDHSSRKYGF